MALFPIVTDVKLLQYKKALRPILLTVLPMVTSIKPVHDSKAHSPMLTTPLGIVKEMRPLHSAKAYSSIFVKSYECTWIKVMSEADYNALDSSGLIDSSTFYVLL